MKKNKNILIFCLLVAAFSRICGKKQHIKNIKNKWNNKIE